VENHGGSDRGSNGSAQVEVVEVLVSARNAARFEVYENGAKLFDGPDVLPVGKGETRTIVLKAAGFKDKVVVVDGTKRKLAVALVRAPVVNTGGSRGSGSLPTNAGSGTGPVNSGQGSGHIYTPQLGPDCSNKILDPKSKACVDQYCAKHQDEDKCHME